MDSLVSRLLDLSRIERRDKLTEIEKLKILPIIENVLKVYGTHNRLIISKNITNAQNMYYKQQTFGKRYNADRWSTQTIRNLLDFTTNLWNFRCNKYHSDDIITPNQQIRHKAMEILELIQGETNLIPIRYSKIRKQTKNALKTTNIQNVIAWITRVDHVVQMNKNIKNTTKISNTIQI